MTRAIIKAFETVSNANTTFFHEVGITIGNQVGSFLIVLLVFAIGFAIFAWWVLKNYGEEENNGDVRTTADQNHAGTAHVARRVG